MAPFDMMLGVWAFGDPGERALALALYGALILSAAAVGYLILRRRFVFWVILALGAMPPGLMIGGDLWFRFVRAEPGIKALCFSHDGREVILTICRERNCGIVFYTVEASRFRALPRPEGESWSEGVQSPDGREMAFRFCGTGANSSCRIVLTDMASGHVTPVAPDRREWQAPGPPAFSPDGTRLAFMVQRGADSDIVVLDRASMEEVSRISNHQFAGLSPLSFLDSRTLLFSARILGGNPHRENAVLALDISGRGDQPMLKPLFVHGEDMGRPWASRDGQKILFTSRTNEMDGNPGGGYRYDLFIREDGQIRRLTDATSPFSRNHERNSRFIQEAAIAPDGSLAAFHEGKPDTRMTFWLVGTDGKNFRRVDVPEDLGRR